MVYAVAKKRSFSVILINMKCVWELESFATESFLVEETFLPNAHRIRHRAVVYVLLLSFIYNGRHFFIFI